ncbi:MAG: ribosomal protein S18 acetylase RimI-like enzyme [Natronomonas sp.]|jgi:ribosomal protein S18 acetylase RimI-like enzyme
MTGENRGFPDEAAEDFEAPPITFEDREGREIEIDPVGMADKEPIAEMYDAFDQEDRAQGIPPANPSRVRDWLDTLLEDGLNVAAWDGEHVAGHSTLVPDGEGAYELAIFVLQDYQGAGIGRRLLRAMLGYGQERGVGCVWLSVERWNRRAIDLYESIGFENYGRERFEQEMSIRLLPDDGDDGCDRPPERDAF